MSLTTSAFPLIRNGLLALVALVLLAGAPAWATWTIEQVVPFPPGPPSGCPAGNQCTLGPFPATTAGSTLALGFGIQGDGYDSPVQISSAYTCSSGPPSTPCDPMKGNVIDTFTIPTDPGGTHVCADFIGTHSVDCAYVISGAGEATYVTINTTDTLQTNRWFPSMTEALSGAGTQTFDVAGAAKFSQVNIPNAPHPGVSLTLSPTNDFIFQINDAESCQSGGVDSCSITPTCSGQTYYPLFDDHYAAAYALNTSCGTAPAWTCTGDGCGIAGVVGAVAFKE